MASLLEDPTTTVTTVPPTTTVTTVPPTTTTVTTDPPTTTVTTVPPTTTVTTVPPTTVTTAPVKIPCCPPKIKYIYPPPVSNTTKLPRNLPPSGKIRILPFPILTDPATISTTISPTTTKSPTSTTSSPRSTSTTIFCYKSNCKKLNF